MTVNGSAAASMGAAATENPRPYCQSANACRAKTPGRHCVPCTQSSPEVRERKSAGVRRVMEERPSFRERKSAQARSLSANPEVLRRRSQRMKEQHSRPEVKARHREACLAAAKARRDDPVRMAASREHGKQLAQYNREHNQSPEAKAKRAHGIRAYQMAWCPESHWDFNRELKRKGFPLAERKRIILTEVQGAPENGAEIVRRNAEAMQLKHQRDLASRY
jgi:hypothetical protein